MASANCQGMYLSRALHLGRYLPLSLAMGLAGWAMPALAQEEAAQIALPQDKPCWVQAQPGSQAGVQELRAICRGQGLILGEASNYQAVYNEALQATLVDMWLDGERRLLLITIQEDGLPLLEDLSGQIALAAGRGPMSGLDGLEIDLDRYLVDGEIAVRPRTGDAPEEKGGKVGIGEQIALERARRQGAAVKN